MKLRVLFMVLFAGALVLTGCETMADDDMDKMDDTMMEESMDDDSMKDESMAGDDDK